MNWEGPESILLQILSGDAMRLEELRSRMGGRRNETGAWRQRSGSVYRARRKVPEPELAGLAQTCVSGERAMLTGEGR